MIDVVAALERAAGDPGVRRSARRMLAALITDGDLLQDFPPHTRALRPSDSGSCRLALWSEINRRDDIGRDPINDRLTRLDIGSLVGAWEACLLAADAIKHHRDYRVMLEHVPQGGGHIDALVIDEETEANTPVEFKSGWDGSAIVAPHAKGGNRSHALQAATYAMRVGAEQFVIVYIKPAVKAKRLEQFVYDTADWVEAVAEEEARLLPALGDDPPSPDPQYPWSCYTCRASWCAENKNKRAPVAVADAALSDEDFA